MSRSRSITSASRRGGDIAEIVLGREALAGLGRVLEARGFGQAERSALERRLLADLRFQACGRRR